MAATHFTTCYLAIDNTIGTPVDFTSYVKGITINFSREELDRSYAGCVGKARGAGLFDWEVIVECFNDFADNTVDEVLHGIVDAGTAVELSFRPSSAAQSANNPTYFGIGLVSEYPLAMVHGEDNVVSFTVRGSDGAAMTRTAT